MSAPPVFDPWAVLAEIGASRPDVRNFRNFRSGTPRNSNPATAANWTADDWREHFEERLAVALVDGEQPEPEARRIAHECCLVRWLEIHPVTSEPDRCAWCGKANTPGNVVPFGAEPLGHVWLHPGCWRPWYDRRRAEAADAIERMGITADGGT